MVERINFSLPSFFAFDNLIFGSTFKFNETLVI